MLHGLAWGTLGLTLLMIVAGGLVTNTGSALAVPDWPTTFGQNMFRYPWSGMVGGVLYEHGHRLLGTGVGLATVALWVAAWLLGAPGRVRVLATLAVILVSVQGLLGGLRVLLLRDTLAIVHGVLAQAFLALTVVLTRSTAPLAAPLPEASIPAGLAPLARLGAAATAVVFGQIVLGALATHGRGVTAHLGGAVVVAALVTLVVLEARQVGLPALDRLGRWVGGVLVAQVLLGLGALAGRLGGAGTGGGLTGVGLPVAHRLAGALLLSLTLALALAAAERARARPPRATSPSEPRIAADRARA